MAPRPTSTRASCGSAAASPQTPIGLPFPVAAAPTVDSSRSNAGCHGSFSVATAPSCRSAAKVYWARSFVPTETKSTASRTSCAVSAAEGTSIMTPARGMPAACARSVNHAASSAVATIGAITETSAPESAAAATIASNCRSSTSGRSKATRIPRTPSAGFGSLSGERNTIGLSAPASSVRTTTGRPANGASTPA